MIIPGWGLPPGSWQYARITERPGCTRMPNGHPPKDRYGLNYGQSNIHNIPRGHKLEAKAPSSNIALSFSPTDRGNESVHSHACRQGNVPVHQMLPTPIKGRPCTPTSPPVSFEQCPDTPNRRQFPVESPQPPRTHTKGLPNRSHPQRYPPT